MLLVIENFADFCRVTTHDEVLQDLRRRPIKIVGFPGLFSDTSEHIHFYFLVVLFPLF